MRPPRALPTNKLFFLFNTTRFISRSETLCRLPDYAAWFAQVPVLLDFSNSVMRHNSYGLFRLASMPGKERRHEQNHLGR